MARPTKRRKIRDWLIHDTNHVIQRFAMELQGLTTRSVNFLIENRESPIGDVDGGRRQRPYGLKGIPNGLPVRWLASRHPIRAL